MSHSDPTEQYEPRPKPQHPAARRIEAKIRAEAGTFAPRPVGAMAQSAREARIVVTNHPRGIHALLCRLGIHAWTEHYEGTGYMMQRLDMRCACGAVRRG